jgi:hypothetical protein
MPTNTQNFDYIQLNSIDKLSFGRNQGTLSLIEFFSILCLYCLKGVYMLYSRNEGILSSEIYQIPT